MTRPIYPTAKPEDFSIPTDAIRQTISDIREKNGLDLHSFLLLRKGTLLWEEYFRPEEKERLHVLYSVSKSFMATAIGMATDEGLLSLDDPLWKFFPQYEALFDSDWKREINFHHLLIMGAGYENTEMEIFQKHVLLGDLTKAALEVPVIHKPGAHFDYYSLGSYLLSSAFHQICPEGIHSYLQRKLFGPLEITSSVWNVDKDAIPMGGFGLYLKAYDMTKLGQLYLQKGVWKGQQLLSKSFVETATSKLIDNASDETRENPDRHNWGSGYGYQFWQNAFGGYRGDGMMGQYVIVLPEQETVIVMTSDLENMAVPMDAVENHLLPNIS